MGVLGLILWTLGLAVGLTWSYGVRTNVRTGQGVQQQTVNQTALILLAVVCWSLYTILSKRLLEIYSPLRVTAVTLSIGALVLIPVSIPDIRRQEWVSVSSVAWGGVIYSLLFALVVSYVLWYRSVRAVGNLRTAIYSNLVPVFGALFGILLLGERVTPNLLAGGGCILGGIVLTRLPRRPAKPARGPEDPDSLNSGNPDQIIERETGTHR